MKTAVHFGSCPCPASILIDVGSAGEALSRIVRFVLDAPQVSERHFWAWSAATTNVIPETWPCKDVLRRASYAAYVTVTAGFIVVRLYKVRQGRRGACVRELALPKPSSSLFSWAAQTLIFSLLLFVARRG